MGSAKVGRGKKLKAQSIFKHSKLCGNIFMYDMGIILLKENLVLSDSIQPIALVSDPAKIIGKLGRKLCIWFVISYEVKCS